MKLRFRASRRPMQPKWICYQTIMGFGVFIHRSDSIYDDSPAERYQFPSQYLQRVQACLGDWIIYYEPRKVTETRGYFALARVEQVIPDPAAPGMYLALIEPEVISTSSTLFPSAEPTVLSSVAC